ncbi:MAG: hypothetical protein RR424_10710 [Oscillospiraceae bacterium]
MYAKARLEQALLEYIERVIKKGDGAKNSRPTANGKPLYSRGHSTGARADAGRRLCKGCRQKTAKRT